MTCHVFELHLLKLLLHVLLLDSLHHHLLALNLVEPWRSLHHIHRHGHSRLWRLLRSLLLSWRHRLSEEIILLIFQDCLLQNLILHLHLVINLLKLLLVSALSLHQLILVLFEVALRDGAIFLPAELAGDAGGLTACSLLFGFGFIRIVWRCNLFKFLVILSVFTFSLDLIWLLRFLIW